MSETIKIDKYNTIWFGIGLTLLLHIIFVLLTVFVIPVGIFVIGLTQLIYIVPAVIISMVKMNKKKLGQGLIIGAGITFLLNSACFGIFLGAFL